MFDLWIRGSDFSKILAVIVYKTLNARKWTVSLLTVWKSRGSSVPARIPKYHLPLRISYLRLRPPLQIQVQVGSGTMAQSIMLHRSYMLVSVYFRVQCPKVINLKNLICQVLQNPKYACVVSREKPIISRLMWHKVVISFLYRYLRRNTLGAQQVFRTLPRKISSELRATDLVPL